MMRQRNYYILAAVLLLLALVKIAQDGRIMEIVIGRTDNSFFSENFESRSQPNSTWFFDNKDVRQNDPDILNYLRDHHLTPPSKEPYNLAYSVGNPSDFSSELKKMFGHIRNGFFIECGANDGEFSSNTLALERDQNWTGLLIEANRFIVPELRQKHRKAWIADVCLSLKPYPQKVKYLHRSPTEHSWYKGNGIIDEGNATWVGFADRGQYRAEYISAGSVNCFPLFSLLSAINVTRVDYFSLDIEGVEFKVLQSIPFDAVDIRVMSIESNLIPEGVPALVQFMESKGFRKEFSVQIEIFFVKKN